MPGFFISNMPVDIELKNIYSHNCRHNSLQYGTYTIKRNTLNKFMDDKVFYEDTEHIIITEGVILNKITLMQQYQKDSFADTIIAMSAANRETFYKEFRGSFSGAIYYKADDEWIVYTNHIGDHAVFYFYDGNNFIAGSQVNYLLDVLREIGVQLTLEEKAVWNMLTFAFMEADETYAKEIRRLRGGTYLKIKVNDCRTAEYHRFSKNAYDLSQKVNDEIIDLLDDKFRAAIRLEYEKDLEYGNEHLTDLSGGLDSRMNSWVACELGYQPLQHITYCQANYQDELIAKKIADHWKNELLVKPLDDAVFMYDVDSIVSMNYGLSLYSGITGGKRMLASLNMDRYGVEHTGMLGDVVIGTFYQSIADQKKCSPDGMYSCRLKSKISKRFHDTFDEHELYLLYTRGFQGAACTHLIRQNYTEVCSPFLDVDFLEFCLSIPLEYRLQHKLYKQWIIKKYPAAAKFKWEKIGTVITEANWFVYLRKVFRKGPLKLLSLLHIKFKHFEKNGMNPMEYWYLTNAEMNEYMDKYFSDSLQQSLLSDEIKNEISSYYESGTVIEKTQAITALAALKYYFMS